MTNALTLASAKGGYSLFVGIAINGIGGNDESVAAGNHFDNSRSYLMWAFGARREKLGLDGGDIEQMSGEELRNTALCVMGQRSWDERFRALVRLADADTINAIAIRTSVPVAAWQTQRVTLSGDATVGELRALGEVSQAVNSTLDLETVLSTIVAKAVQLSGTEAGAIIGELYFIVSLPFKSWRQQSEDLF